MKRLRPSPAHIAALVLALLLLSCEIEDEIRIDPDGTGTYRVKILVEKELAETLPEIRKSAEKEGFRIVGEGETETRHFLVYERDFKSLSEVGDTKNQMSFAATRTGWLKERYEFRASLPRAGVIKVSRKLTIVLPGSVVQNSAGEARGNRVVWDCSNGGTLEVTAEGLALPPVLRGVAIIAGVLTAIAILFVVLRSRARRPVAHCPTCGTETKANARFCAKCGNATTSPAASGG